MEIKPFVKWVGGKTQLLKNINNNLPDDLDIIDTYIEPFVGGGSVMFNVVPKLKNIKYVIINDLNSREKFILDQRYVMGKTQMEVAEELNISQAQVSRLEKKAIKELKKVLK